MIGFSNIVINIIRLGEWMNLQNTALQVALSPVGFNYIIKQTAIAAAALVERLNSTSGNKNLTKLIVMSCA